MDPCEPTSCRFLSNRRGSLGASSRHIYRDCQMVVKVPEMRLIRWRERQQRIRESQDQAWAQAGNVPDDPGLRERYSSLPRAPIRLIACPLVKDPNHGGLVRLADAFRLERVDLSPEEDGAVDFSASRGARQFQPYRWVPVEEAIAEARADGYTLAALHFGSNSVALDKVEWRFPLAIVLGSENDGVPVEIEAMCDLSIAIPLYGMVTSLNVVSATAIVVHEAVRSYALSTGFRPARTASQRLVDGFGP